jgi:hypothetical protein
MNAVGIPVQVGFGDSLFVPYADQADFARITEDATTASDLAAATIILSSLNLLRTFPTESGLGEGAGVELVDLPGLAMMNRLSPRDDRITGQSRNLTSLFKSLLEQGVTTRVIGDAVEPELLSEIEHYPQFSYVAETPRSDHLTERYLRALGNGATAVIEIDGGTLSGESMSGNTARAVIIAGNSNKLKVHIVGDAHQPGVDGRNVTPKELFAMIPTRLTLLALPDGTGSDLIIRHAA